MFRFIYLYLASFLLLSMSCSSKKIEGPLVKDSSDAQKATPNFSQTNIVWDKWGVPHIYAKDNNELFYSFGYAQAHSHINTILKLYANSRGKAAEYWGEEHLKNDMMVHVLGFPEQADLWYTQQNQEFKTYIDQFVKGMNDYVKMNPNAVSDQNKLVLPVESRDILLHAIFVIYSRFVGGGDLQEGSRWTSEKGSNTYAVGPKKSESGKAMLVMNPHLPWFDEWLFYEGHFNTPELNLYGATLVGLPTLGIAFNENLGWSHTNNTIDNADLYEIELKDQGYVLDGITKSFNYRQKVLKIREENGSFKEYSLDILTSPDHGAVIKKEANKALALKLPGADKPYPMVQWWNMGTSKSLKQFKEAIHDVQIPFFNIMYADKAGNIFYIFNGQVPKRKHGDWDFWQKPVDGSKSENLWQGIHSYEDLPKVENPSTGWLQNANDPPWTSTIPQVLNPKDFPSYMSPVEMNFRPQRAAQMMLEDEKVSFDELVEDKLSTRLLLADRILDDLNSAVATYGNSDAKEAMMVLNKWDRHADSDSKGMALFFSWAHTIRSSNPSNYAIQWSSDSPVTTPDGLAKPEAAVRALEGVVAKFKEANTPLNIEWGKIYRIRYGQRDLPGNGADGSVGLFRIAWSGGLENDGTYTVAGGDSWQGIIEFGDKVRAKVLLSYGNSTQESSPNFGDQLVLFSKKQMRDCTFYPEDVRRAAVRTEILVNGIFVAN